MLKDWRKVIDDLLEKLNICDAKKKELLGFNVWIGVSSKGENITQFAQNVSEVCKERGATILSETGKETPHNCPTLKKQINDAHLIIMFAVTPGVSAEALDICYGDKANGGTNKYKMCVYMPDEYCQGYIHHRLVDLGAKIQRLPKSHFDEPLDEKLFRQCVTDIVDVFLSKRQKDSLSKPFFHPSIGIVTALTVELEAVKLIFENPQVFKIRSPSGAFNIFYHGKLSADKNGTHEIAIACFSGAGTTKATSITTELLHAYPTIETIFMVGIAGGIPDKNGKLHVRLGDIIVCDENGIIQYDMVKKHTKKTEHNPPARPVSSDFSKLIDHYFNRPQESLDCWSYLSDIIKKLGIKRPSKCPLNDSNRPWFKDVKGKTIPHPHDPDRVKGRPKIYKGRIGCANMVLKSATFRNKLKNLFKLQAVEMESSGIAEATWQTGKSYFVVRGICDYANDCKEKSWQPYAAAAAAALTRDLIEYMPIKPK